MERAQRRTVQNSFKVDCLIKKELKVSQLMKLGSRIVPTYGMMGTAHILKNYTKCRKELPVSSRELLT